MRWRDWLAGSMVFGPISWGQTPEPQTSSQIRLQFAPGQQLAQDLDQRDGRMVDPAIANYVQAIANRLASAAGGRAIEVRITRGSDTYASLLPSGVLYISGALIERIENEAELAGLLAHQLAHLQRGALIPSQTQGTIPMMWPACVLASQVARSRFGPDRRDPERESTRDAVGMLRRAGYEPSGVLDLLSKLAFEHPAWAKAIVPEDLLNLRIMVESDAPPQSGYVLDSSSFVRQHANAVSALGHVASRIPAPTLGPSSGR
jgi:predicted Zn-dependent protease